MQAYRNTNMTLRFLCIVFMAALVCTVAAGCKKGPKTIKTVTGDDGSKWEQVSKPGFGNVNNVSIAAMAEFQDSIYAVTRNDVSGFELWRTKGRRWKQVEVPGFTDSSSPFHDFMSNVFSDMIVFQDKLYIVVSSGYQGSKLFKSVGFEMWRFDGERWEPIVSQANAPKLEGTITAIESCAAGDGSGTAQIIDTAVQWTDNQSKDGILWITSGAGRGRVFEIVSNTPTALTVQQNEKAGEAEDTVCEQQTFVNDPPFPKYTVGTIAAGDTYKILTGQNVNGFGEIWNKSIVDLEIYKDELYASVGFNYEKGARIWKSADGMSWGPSSDYSMGLFHGYDPNGDPTGFCLITGFEYRNGIPVSSSLPKFGKLTVNEEEIMVIGGTGTSGCNGRGLRIFRLYDDGWKPIVDYFVDNNTTGTNENGIGDDGSSSGGFAASNSQAWTWTVYADKLFTGILRNYGARIMYTATASADDSAWKYVVGGDATEPDGFGYDANICFNIFNYGGSTLFAGTIDEESFAKPPVGEERGADIWRATGPADALVWTQVTKDAFGDPTIMQFETLREFYGDFYIVASSFGGSTTPDAARDGYTGAIVYRLVSEKR